MNLANEVRSTVAVAKLSSASAVVATFVALFGSTASAQAPRGTAETKVGAAKVSVEYGAPPWSGTRRGQLDQLKTGAAWRLGADTRTTMVVEGGDVYLGDTLIEAGGYGLNVVRLGPQEWTFAVYDGSDTNVALADAEFDAPARFAEKTDAPPERLVVSFEELATRALVVRFGPMELRAPVVAAQTKTTTLELGGEQANAHWWSRPASPDAKSAEWCRVGKLDSVWVADVDCGMDVETKLTSDASATVRFSNRERRRVTDRIARLARSPTLGDAGTKKQLEDELAGLAADPLPFDVEVALKPATKPLGRLGAELVRRDGKLVVVVDVGDRHGEAVVDESKLLPAKK